MWYNTPQQLNDIKQFNRTATRGGMRWVRMTYISCVQWKDNRIISILSTIHMANKETTAIRRTKVNGKYAKKFDSQKYLQIIINKWVGLIRVIN